MTTTPPIKPGFDRLIVSVLVVIGVAFLALAFVGCNEDPPTKPIERVGLHYPDIVMVEGCEYIRFGTAYSYFALTHKGNCSNPIHCTCDTLR